MAGAISMATASPTLLLTSPLSSSTSSQSSSSSCLSSTVLRRIPRQNSASLRWELRIISHRKQSPLATASSASDTTAWSGEEVLEVAEIKERSRKWVWRERYSINYFVQLPLRGGGQRPPLVLVHGFGASIPHWRRNIMTLAQDQMVYAVDLLGFGLSDKPAGFAYTMETWAELLLDFLNEVVREPAVLVGNSVGSLACLVCASESSQPRSLVQGLVLLNCAGGMNNKAIVDDWRIKLLLPLLWFIDFILKQKAIASAIFERVKQRESLRNVLLSVYGCKESVDDTLVEIIREPADDEGALDAFISIVTGPPGPTPVQLMPKITVPVLLLWGDQDPFTPLDGPVGKYFMSLSTNEPNVSLFVLEGVGHCPHDDRPTLVHEKLLPWLAQLQSV
ncbi:hypothetical protein RND81_02G173900 [Saponaria officinalis]|uniref:AB hydrolase-1 domain-containing protein n=1 Tax=Saponaria officinalis TaxID=3572 RepID=A0AAW1MWS0_SAPOF